MKESPLRLDHDPVPVSGGNAPARSGEVLQSHHGTAPRQSPSTLPFPTLKPEGDRHRWLCEVRDYLGAESVTVTTVHSHASGSRDPSSSLRPAHGIRQLVQAVLQELNPREVDSALGSRWLGASFAHPTYTVLLPTPEPGKASLVIVEFAKTVAEKDMERVNLAVHLISREARLVQETERRVSAEEMFYHSQKLSCVGQLAGGIAHDFNNLLTVIQGHTGFVEMAAHSWNDPKVIESIELIQNATSQSVGLVKQLLLFSRDQKASFETLDLNRVVTDFAKMVRRMVEETITIRLELSEHESHLRADLGMLSQILMNLVVNSRDAMPDGGEIVIRTELTGEVEDDEWVALTIADTGCGIPADKVSKVFDPFFTTKPKGTGLGLANVAGLVRQHHGKIEVQSEPGKGTQVKILFPLVDAPVAAPESTLSSRSIPSAPKCITGSTVLLVEDEAAVRKLVRKLLEMHGCTVIEADSGRRALEIWPDVCDEVSVVVSDVVMPEGVSGWELAKELHRRNPGIGILLTSGYNERPRDHGLEEEENIDFLQKPYEAHKLKNILYRLIKGEKSAG